MKKQLIFSLITILSLNCYAQITFEKGYYINNSNQNVDCLIKNIDWYNNPTEFEYKLTENSEVEKASIRTIKEFGVLNISRFIRRKVKMDRSTVDFNTYSYDKNPVFKEEELFLKVLISGKANLYEYIEGSLMRYFYSIEDSDIEQLICKSYKIDDKVRWNNQFRHQLWNNLKCSDFTITKLENIDYKKDELVDFFVDYNTCHNREFINFDNKQKRDLFNLNIRPGINRSSLSIQNSGTNIRDRDFDKETTFRFGIEAEFIMGFNKNKWAILVEPTYQYYNTEVELVDSTTKVNYTSIEVPVGIRHYFFLNDNSKFFINMSHLFDFSNTESNIDFGSGIELDIKTFNNWVLGFGYKYNDRYSFELRYHTNRNILKNYKFWSSDYKTVSVIFGYSLF